MATIKQFVESITVPNTAKVVRYVLDGVDAQLENCNKEEIEKFILELQPNSPKAITTICYVLGLYARWVQEQEVNNGAALYAMVQSLDKKELWKKAKPVARQKFISNKQFCRVVHDIGLYEEFNELYYQTLFRCIYEGIYNDDMSVLKNLRGSDVHGTTVTLHEDNGHTYNIEISISLAEDLIKLSEKRIWERKNRNGICRINMRGLYTDSVFKIEERKTSSSSTEDSYRFTFYAKLRKIVEEYLDFRLLPFQLYISGIMHRAVIKLTQNNIPIDSAFADNSRDREANAIISSELVRCNYTTDISNFKEIVKGHLEYF